jgi:hypothetical protein
MGSFQFFGKEGGKTSFFETFVLDVNSHKQDWTALYFVGPWPSCKSARWPEKSALLIHTGRSFISHSKQSAIVGGCPLGSRKKPNILSRLWPFTESLECRILFHTGLHCYCIVLWPSPFTFKAIRGDVIWVQSQPVS